MVTDLAAERAADLALLAKLAEAGRFTPAIDRRQAFQKMANAHHCVDRGHKGGRIVVTVSQDNT